MWGTSSSSGSYFLRRIRAPPTESVASVAPWYEVQRLMNVERSASPRSTHTWRASLSATSIASDPPDVKWIQSRSPGVIAATLRRQPVGRLRARRCCPPRRAAGRPARPSPRTTSDAAVAQVHDRDARDRVQVAIALVVPDVARPRRASGRVGPPRVEREQSLRVRGHRARAAQAPMRRPLAASNRCARPGATAAVTGWPMPQRQVRADARARSWTSPTASSTKVSEPMGSSSATVAGKPPGSGARRRVDAHVLRAHAQRHARRRTARQAQRGGLPERIRRPSPMSAAIAALGRQRALHEAHPGLAHERRHISRGGSPVDLVLGRRTGPACRRA